MAHVTFALLVISFIVGNIYKLGGVSLLDLSVFLFWLSTLHKNNYRLSLPKPLLIFLSVALLSLFLASRWGTGAQIIGLQYLLRFAIYSSLPFFTKPLFKKSTLHNLIYYLGLVTLMTGLLQYIFLPDVRFLSAWNWDDHYFRIIGSFLDPGFTGLLLVLFFTYYISHNHRLLTIFSFIALALTYSRSSYLAFLVAMGALSFQKKSPLFFAKAVILLVVTIAILPRASQGEGVKLERTSTIQARLINWGQSFQIFSDHPVMGVGFNTYRYAQRDYGFLEENKWQVSHAGAGADSSLLFVAATTGMLGLTTYLFYLKHLYKILDTRYFIPILVHSIFLNSLFYPAIMLLMALLIMAGNSREPLSS